MDKNEEAIRLVEAMIDELLTVGDVSHTLHRSAQWVRTLIDRGELDCVKDSRGRRLVPKTSLLRYIEQREAEGAS